LPGQQVRAQTSGLLGRQQGREIQLPLCKLATGAPSLHDE